MAKLVLLTAATATNSAPQSHAKGTITTVAVANLVDTEIVTISDGQVAKVFEFDVNGTGVTAGRVQVNVSTDTTAAHVRDRFITAINATTSGAWTITAAIGAADGIALKNTTPGTAGNVTITEGVADAGFAVTGMTGGADNVGVSLTGGGATPAPRPDAGIIFVTSVAGFGTMTAGATAPRLWGYSSSAKEWFPCGTGADATKGCLNFGTALGETSANLVTHSERVQGLSAFERLYLEITATPGGTSTAISAWLVTE